MTLTPFISIIVPAYNNASELNNCLQSIQQSELKHQCEVIVIDDCSPTDGRSIEQIAQLYKTRFYRLNENGGPGIARNRGAHESRGNILVFIDSDCVAPPGWLSKIIQPVRDGKHPAATSCYCGPVKASWITIFQDEDYLYRMPSTECSSSFVNSCNFAIDRNVFFKCGGFPERRLQEDFLLGLMLVRRGTPARYMPGAGVKHDYCGTLSSYLKQRFTFAYNAVGSSLVRDKLRSEEASANARSFNPIRTASGILFISLTVISLVLSGISSMLNPDVAAAFLIVGITSLVMDTIVHGCFLIFLIKRHGLRRSFSYIPLLYLVDLVYAYAILKAIFNIGRKK